MRRCFSVLNIVFCSMIGLYFTFVVCIISLYDNGIAVECDQSLMLHEFRCMLFSQKSLSLVRF